MLMDAFAVRMARRYAPTQICQRQYAGAHLAPLNLTALLGLAVMASRLSSGILDRLYFTVSSGEVIVEEMSGDTDEAPTWFRLLVTTAAIMTRWPSVVVWPSCRSALYRLGDPSAYGIDCLGMMVCPDAWLA